MKMIMKIIRVIQFFFRRISWKPRTAPSFSFEVDKKPNKIAYAWGVFVGFFYSFFQKRRESLRIHYRNQERKKTEYTIPMQIVRYSMSTVMFLIALLAIVVLGDWGIEKLVTALSHIQASWFLSFVSY